MKVRGTDERMELAEQSSERSMVAALKDLEAALTLKTNDPKMVAAVVEKVQQWAGEQSFLTRLLCKYVLTAADRFANEREPDLVDVIARQKIIKGWRKGEAAGHLKQIQTTLLEYVPRDSLLILYLQVLKKNNVPYKTSPEQALLLRIGLITSEEGSLTVSNAIYENVFNEAWLERHLPGITKPVTIVKGDNNSGPSKAIANPSVSRPLTKRLWLAGGLAAIVSVAFLLWPKEQRSNIAGIAGEYASPIQTSLPARSQTQLTLLGDTFSGYSTFRNTDFQEVLQQVGITVDYADEFDQTLRAQKLNRGKADLMVTSLDQFLQQQPKGKIVGLLDRTVGADAVVLNTKQYPGLDSLLDLQKLAQKSHAESKKLSITYAGDTPSEYLALVLDAQFDTFNLSDFELRPVADASEAWDLMQNPEENVAIAVLWEPYVAQAQQQGYNVVLSSKDTPNAIVDVLIASDKLIKTNPDIISQLLEKYYRRIDANIRNASQLQAQVAEDGNLSRPDAATIINGIDFFTATEAKDWFTNGTLSRRIGSTAAVLTLANRIASPPADSSVLYAENFVAEAASNTQALIDLIRADNPELASKLAGAQPVRTEPSSVPVKRIPEAVDIGNFQVRGQVTFDTNSAQLTIEGKETLDQLAKELKEFNENTIAMRVIGHTSRSGDANLNLALSQQRATAVANYLKEQKVELDIQPEGKGFGEPLPEIEPSDVRNQRTEIRLVRLNRLARNVTD